jgi:arylsulfatase A-like enzyme
MLTGRYPSATRVRTNHNTADATFARDLFQVFQGQGYRTALCGKNHSYLARADTDYWYETGHLRAEDDDVSAETQAFAEFLASTHFHMARDATPFPVEVQFPCRIVNRALEWIREGDRDRPFLLWMSFGEPHNPYQVPEPYYSLFPPADLPPNLADASALDSKGFKYRWCRDRFVEAFPGFEDDLPRARANYLGMLRLIDDQVRRFVQGLDAAGLREETLLIYLADHGDFVGEYGLVRKGPDLPEALTRIPLVVQGPGIRRQCGPSTAHVSIADIMPTLCEALGVPLPGGVQGKSLWPLLTGQAVPPDEFASAYAEHGFGGLYYGRREALEPADDGMQASPDGVRWGGYDCLNSWTQSGQMRMVRRGDWKLVYDMQGRGQLYNVAQDPSETVDRYADRELAPLRQALLEELLSWLLRVQDPLPLPRRRYVIKTDPRNYWTPHRS